jgi:signal transduction histidine kinase
MDLNSVVPSRLQYSAVDRLPVDCAALKSRFSGFPQLSHRLFEQVRYALRKLRLPNGRRSTNKETTTLGEALACIPNDMGFPAAVGFRVIVHGREKELRSELSDEVYRIVREAIVNAWRHSQAGDIETELEYRPTGLRIAVRDNGCGIDPQELRWELNGHSGLLGMRDRAEQIGARLRLLSGVAVGTEVELCVPGQGAFVYKGQRTRPENILRH